MTDRSDERPPVKALATGMDVVEELAAAGPLGPTELAGRLGYAKSSIHDYLRTLVQRGYAVRNDDGTYGLTVRFLGLGHEARDGSRLSDVAAPKLERLAAATEATTSLAVLSGANALCVDVVHADDTLRTCLRPGSALPLHCTAAGKALLAASNQPERLLARTSMDVYTAETVTDRDELVDRLVEIQQRGLATESEEFTEGIRGVASSVDTNEGHPSVAVSVHTTAEKLTGKQFHQDVPGQLIKTTNQIRNELSAE